VFEPSPIALLGGVLALISCFVAWDGYDDSFDVPLQFLWDKDGSGGVSLGIPLVSVAGAVALFAVSAVEPFVFLRRLGGVVLLGVTALFVVQLGRATGGTTFRRATSRLAPTWPVPEASSRFSPPPGCGRSHAYGDDPRRSSSTPETLKATERLPRVPRPWPVPSRPSGFVLERTPLRLGR
jgi:hypothetical protein